MVLCHSWQCSTAVDCLSHPCTVCTFVHPPAVDLSLRYSATTVKAGVMHRASARTHLYLGEENCDKNMENFVSCLKTAASCCSGRTAFVAIKLTALCRPQFLVSYSACYGACGTHECMYLCGCCWAHNLKHESELDIWHT